MAYTSNTEFDAETRVQKTNEVRPLDIYEGVHSILKRDIWKWLLGWSDTTTDLKYDMERAENDPTYNYTDDVYPAKIVNGVPAPEYGEDLVQTKWNPDRKDADGNSIGPGYEEVPAENQTRMEIDGAILPEHDLFLHEIYRYLGTLYPDHPDWIELLTHTEIVDAFENAAAMVDYKPDDKFFLLVAQNMEDISDLKDAKGNQIDEVKKEELKLLLRNLTNNSFRRKFYGASDGLKMFASGVSELASVFPVGEYLPIMPIHVKNDKITIDDNETTIAKTSEIEDPMNLQIDIFDPNFKKPFRIIDWTGESRDIPDKADSQFPISGYTTPGTSKSIVEIHSPEDLDPLGNSAQSVVNSRTFFRVPYTTNSIAYFNSLDKSQIKGYSRIIHNSKDDIIGYETLRPMTNIIKYDTTQKLPITYDTIYNYGKFEKSYDVSKKLNIENSQKNVYRQWRDVDIKNEKDIAQLIFNPTETSAIVNLATCVLRKAKNTPIRYTLDPMTNGLILEPSNMLSIYNDQPIFKWNKQLKRFDLVPDEIDNEKTNPNLVNLPIKKGELLSSDEIIDDFSTYSYYSYIGSNKGKLLLKCAPFYKEGDKYPIEFGEFSESILTSDYTSERYPYGVIIETVFGDKIVMYGSIHPIWDTKSEYIQPATIDFNIQNIPMYKDEHLLKYLYGDDLYTKYSADEISHLKKNRELFAFIESETLANLNDIFKVLDFSKIDLDTAGEEVDVRALVDKYDDHNLGQFLVYHQYMNIIDSLCKTNKKKTPKEFVFVISENTSITFETKKNKEVIEETTLEMLKTKNKYELKGVFTGSEDPVNLKFQNDYETVAEDFTFGKGSTIEKLFMISKDAHAEEESKAKLIYNDIEGIPNSAIIDQFDFGHLSVVEWGDDLQEGYIFKHTFKKESQNEKPETFTVDNWKRYYSYDTFDVTVKDFKSKDPNATHTVTAAFPKINDKIPGLYGYTNDLKLNIIGKRLWDNFTEAVSPKDGKYLAETLIPVPLEIEATREPDANNDDALKTLIFSGEENTRKFEALTTGDTVEGNGIPSNTYIIQKGKNEVVLNNTIPKSGTHIYKFNCTVEAYPTDLRENFINYKQRLRDEGSLVNISPFENGLWGSDEWPHVSQAYIDGLVDPQDFEPINPQQTASVIYKNKIDKATEEDEALADKTSVENTTIKVPLSSVSIGTKMYYELNLKKLIHLPNRLGHTENLMNVEWLDYFDSNMNTIAQANESTNVGTNLMMQTDISGFFTRRDNANYTDDDLHLKFQTFGYNDATVPCYIQLGTGGTSYQKYFKSPSLVQKPTVYGATFFDHPTPDVKEQQEYLVHEGGDWKKRFVYSVGDISVIESGSGLSSVDQPLFEMPLGEYDIQKKIMFDTEPGVETGAHGRKTVLDTISASFQKQTYKNLTKKLPESEIQVLNRDFIESCLIDKNDEDWIYKGEWKPSVITVTRDGKQVLDLKYPNINPSEILPGKHYTYAITDAFSDFITDKDGSRVPINIPATSILAYYKLENGEIAHRIISPDFAGVTFGFDSKANYTTVPFLKKEIEDEAGATITKYIAVYTSVSDNYIEFYHSLGGLMLFEDAVFTGPKGSSFTLKQNCTAEIEEQTYLYTIAPSAIQFYALDNIKFEGQPLKTISYTFDAKTRVLNISASSFKTILNGKYTTTNTFAADDEAYAPYNKLAHACYILGAAPSATFSLGDLTRCSNVVREKFYDTEHTSKLPIIAYVTEEEVPKRGLVLTLNYEVMIYPTLPPKTWDEMIVLPTFKKLYNGLFASSISFDSNNHPDELSFFDGTFGTVYISREEKEAGVPVRNYYKAAVDSGLRVIQDHQNKLKLPRSFVADGSYNIELTLDPHFISQGYLYDNNDKIINTGDDKIVNFNVSQSKIYYDDVNHAFYTFADLYNEVPTKPIKRDKEGKVLNTYVKDLNNLNKKVALKFQEQKFFKDTTYLDAALKAYNIQSEGNKEMQTIYSLEPVKGIPYNTSKYSSSDRILDIQKIAFRSEPDYNCEPVLFSNFTTLKGEVMGISDEKKLVVGNFRKGAANAMTEATLFSGNLKEIDPVNDTHNIREACPPALTDLKVKKPFTGEKIQSQAASEAAMTFKFFKNYLIFEGVINTDAPTQVIASKSNGSEFENVLKVINAGDEIKAVSCLNGGSVQARKSIKITQKAPFIIPQMIRWERGDMIMAGIQHGSDNLYIYMKKVPSLEAVTELGGFTVVTYNVGSADATITDISKIKSSGNWCITLDGASQHIVEVNPNIKGGGEVLPKYNKAQSKAAENLIKAKKDILVYNKNKFAFDKFNSEDISIVDAREKPTDETRILYYRTNDADGNYDDTTVFYVDVTMQPEHITELANGLDGLDSKSKELVTGNVWTINENYQDWHVENAPYVSPAQTATEEGQTEETLDTSVVYTADLETENEAFIQGDKLFLKASDTKSSVDEKQKASQKYWINGLVPSCRDTLEERLNTMDTGDFRNGEVGEEKIKGLLPAAVDGALDEFKAVKETTDEAWDKLSKEEKKGKDEATWKEIRLRRAFSEYEVFLFVDCKLEDNYRSQIVDLTDFEKAMTKQSDGKYRVTYNMPMKELKDGRHVIVNESVPHTYEVDAEGKKIIAYRRYCLDWLQFILPAIDDTVTGSNYILSDNVKKAIINKGESSNDLILVLKNNQTIKLDLNRVRCPADIANTDYWTAFTLPEQTFYLASKTAGKVYVNRMAQMTESEDDIKTYSVPSVTHIKASYEVTNIYKLGSTVVFSGYFESRETIKDLILEKGGDGALRYNDEKFKKPFLMYLQPGKTNLKMIDVTDALAMAPEESIEIGDDTFVLQKCNLVIGSVSAIDNKLIATLKPDSSTSKYFESKIEIAAGDMPDSTIVKVRKTPNTKTLGGANQVMVGNTNSILYWQENGKGIANETDPDNTAYYFDYLYHGAVSFGTTPNISFKTSSMIQLTEGLQADENTSSAFYRYLFAVKTREPISNPFEYYKFAEEYRDPDTDLLKIGETQEVVADESLADKVYMYRECKSEEDPCEDGYPSMEEDTDKQFYLYDTNDEIVYWENSNGKPIYLCNEDGKLISSTYSSVKSRHDKIASDGALDDTWQTTDGALYDFDSAPEGENPFRQAGRPSLRDVQSFSETFEMLKEDDEFRKEIGDCNIESWNSNYGGDKLDKNYFPSATLSAHLSDAQIKQYLIAIEDMETYNVFAADCDTDPRVGQLYLENRMAKAEESLRTYPATDLPPERADAEDLMPEDEARRVLNTCHNLKNLLDFTKEKEGEFGAVTNPYASWTKRFQVKAFAGENFIYDIKYNIFVLNKVRYIDGLVKVLYPSSVPVKTRVVTAYKGLYNKDGELLGVGPDNKYPVTGIYYPQKGYGGLMNEPKPWDKTYLPWNSSDKAAFNRDEELMNTETHPCAVLLYDKYGQPILDAKNKVIHSKKPNYNSFDTMIAQIGRSVPITTKVYSSKTNSLLSFGGIGVGSAQVFYGEDFPEDLKVTPGREEYLRLRILSIANTTDIGNQYRLNDYGTDYKAYEEISKDEIGIFPPNRVYFNPLGIPEPPINGTQLIAANNEFAPKEMIDMRKYVSSKIFRSKNNYAFYADNYMNNNGTPIYQCDENGKFIKYTYAGELPTDIDKFDDDKVQQKVLDSSEVSYETGVLFNPKKPIYNTCEDWFMKEFYLKDSESNPFWQVIKVYPEFNTNTMRFDSKSKVFEYSKASNSMQLVECAPEDTYIMMKKTTLRKTEGTKTTVIPNSSYIDLLPGEVYFLLSQPENETFKTAKDFVKFGISYVNSFNEDSGIHRDIWQSKHFINLPSEINVSYTVNTAEDFANPDNKDAGIVRVSELALLDQNHQIVAYATFPPIEYRSDTQHISFTCFINHTACSDYHNV